MTSDMNAALAKASQDNAAEGPFELGRRAIAALAEIERHQTRAGGLARRTPFWWKQASMRKLEAIGLVKRMAGYDQYKTPGWEITPLGETMCRMSVAP